MSSRVSDRLVVTSKPSNPGGIVFPWLSFDSCLSLLKLNVTQRYNNPFSALVYLFLHVYVLMMKSISHMLSSQSVVVQ